MTDNMETQSNLDHSFDKGALYQAFSHLSRMHTSCSSAFFASFFAYITYLGFYAVQLHKKVDSFSDSFTLLVIPALVPIFLFLRYLAANFAFKHVADDIRVCTHQQRDVKKEECPHLNLYSYLWGSYAQVWITVTQPKWSGKINRAYWSLLGFFMAGSLWYAWRLFIVLTR